jgi:hypothetical protein
VCVALVHFCRGKKKRHPDLPGWHIRRATSSVQTT